MKVHQVLEILSACRDLAVENQDFVDAVMWRDIRERVTEINEMEPDAALGKMKRLGMAFHDLGDLLLKSCGMNPVMPENNVAIVIDAGYGKVKGE